MIYLHDIVGYEDDADEEEFASYNWKFKYSEMYYLVSKNRFLVTQQNGHSIDAMPYKYNGPCSSGAGCFDLKDRHI